MAKIRADTVGLRILGGSMLAVALAVWVWLGGLPAAMLAFFAIGPFIGAAYRQWERRAILAAEG